MISHTPLFHPCLVIFEQLSFLYSRVGDSPIAGSGAYVDNDVGGAAATGDGDVMMRFLPRYYTIQK